MATAIKHRERSRVSKHSEDYNKLYFFSKCSNFSYVKAQVKEERKKHGR